MEYKNQSFEAINYHPPWYLIGDPEQPRMALLYGFIAIATIWQVESISETLLFQKKESIDSSDIRALISYYASNWSDVLIWLVRKPENSRISKTACFGLLLRIVIYLG